MAKTKGKPRWDLAFSPLEVGKQWFYGEVKKLARLHTYEGHETAPMRDALGLAKTKKKTAEVFEAHCVDSWVLAHAIVGGHDRPGNRQLLGVTPLKLHRRELHRRQPGKGGVRSPYGGTRSLGFKRGSIVRHPKHGVCFVGGASEGGVSLHRIVDGQGCARTPSRRTFDFWPIRPGGRGCCPYPVEPPLAATPPRGIPGGRSSSPYLKAGVSVAEKSDD